MRLVSLAWWFKKEGKNKFGQNASPSCERFSLFSISDWREILSKFWKLAKIGWGLNKCALWHSSL
jgi:hypothetical protein